MFKTTVGPNCPLLTPILEVTYPSSIIDEDLSPVRKFLAAKQETENSDDSGTTGNFDAPLGVDLCF